MGVRFVSREVGKRHLVQKWQPAITLAKEVGLPYWLPDWEVLRNHELEGKLEDNFPGDMWVVTEWCPYNGIFCRYRSCASKAVLREVQREFRELQSKPGTPDANWSYLCGIIDKELQQRPVELPDGGVWQEGALQKT